MKIRNDWRSRALGLAVVCAAAVAAAPATASAAVSNFAPDPQSRNFNGGAGGWGASVDQSGACVPLVTCYGVTSSHQENGGPAGAGDGYLRSDLTTVLGALSTTEAIWTSPEFTYTGVGGRKPQSLKLIVARRTNLSAILPVIADDATYGVEAVPSGGGAPVTLSELTSLAGAEDEWVRDPAVAVPRGALQVGADYRLRIVSRFVSGLTVVGSGTVDYDNVRLRARRVVRPAALRRGIRNSTGPAAIAGRRIGVRVRCPAAVHPGRCVLNTTALLRRSGGRATTTKRLRANPGRARVAILRVKPKHRARVASRRKLWIKVNARADGRKVAVKKLVRLRRP